jgi:hypothetical protein
MGIFRTVHAIRQVHPAPEIGQVEHGLQREQRVEQDQRAGHRLLAQEMIQIGGLCGCNGGDWLGLPNWPRFDAAMNQRPDDAGHEEPES